MRLERLDNVAKIIAGQAPPSDSYNKIGAGLPFFQGKSDFGTKYPMVKTWCSEPKKISISRDILISVRAPVGTVNINNHEACIGRGLSAIRASYGNNYEYLFYYLKTNESRISQMGVGSTFKAITQKDLRGIKIPLPENLGDQTKIAHILSKAEKLIAQRKESITLLDEYLKSTFLEMFGNPIKNPNRWSKFPMDAIVTKIISGTSYAGDEKEELSPNESGVLKISAITKGSFDPSEFKAVNKEKILKPIISLQKGMFLISRANTRELIAACCVIPKDYPELFIPDKLWSLVLDETKIRPEYLNHLLKNETYRNLVRKQASGGHDSMLNISMKKFKQLSLVLPPLEIQNQFAQIVEKTEALKTQYNQSLKELENLFGSLSQLAFRGKLNLDQVEAVYDLEYESTDNVREEPKRKDYEKVIAKPKKEKAEKKMESSLWEIARTLSTSRKNIPFNTLEGNAVLKAKFSKVPQGFNFQELETFLIKEGFNYEYDKVRDFVFEKLEAKELIQFYASEDWIKNNRKPLTNSLQDEFSDGHGSIWFAVNNGQE